MKMATRKLTAQEREALAVVAAMGDGEIDTSDPDAPEVRDWSKATRGALFRPVKVPVTMRVDSDVLAWFKTHYAKGYQTRMNAALRAFVEAEERTHGHG
ncbi:MAG: BrnA antitoxin family protein [Alphaproteobacteria bacterium]|nr:BrnA antitoxin family protein [Alphaproteobacteria bacterium]